MFWKLESGLPLEPRAVPPTPCQSVYSKKFYNRDIWHWDYEGK